jgi:hypothetical protein
VRTCTQQKVRVFLTHDVGVEPWSVAKFAFTVKDSCTTKIGYIPSRVKSYTIAYGLGTLGVEIKIQESCKEPLHIVLLPSNKPLTPFYARGGGGG